MQLIHFVRACFPAETFHPFGNRATRHEQDFNALFAECGNLAHPILDQRMVNTGTVISDERGADFDDDTFGLAHSHLHLKNETLASARIARRFVPEMPASASG